MKQASLTQLMSRKKKRKRRQEEEEEEEELVMPILPIEVRQYIYQTFIPLSDVSTWMNIIGVCKSEYNMVVSKLRPFFEEFLTSYLNKGYPYPQEQVSNWFGPSRIALVKLYIIRFKKQPTLYSLSDALSTINLLMQMTQYVHPPDRNPKYYIQDNLPPSTKCECLFRFDPSKKRYVSILKEPNLRRVKNMPQKYNNKTLLRSLIEKSHHSVSSSTKSLMLRASKSNCSLFQHCLAYLSLGTTARYGHMESKTLLKHLVLKNDKEYTHIFGDENTDYCKKLIVSPWKSGKETTKAMYLKKNEDYHFDFLHVRLQDNK